ncbi:hypothetical protein RB6390 [Rhodopirellula baltica SH 1]|uniref:Uncharacterized protein n=1 Tax=Rhodopirellula baltica (strain DSM 10527 / NCIMB 13988 / SH1) TaxID=243090 RepID=Q7UQD1_RHOBA|nr:hypothetical protein RB6390 [Rhodopirellula baltica SH 1]
MSNNSDAIMGRLMGAAYVRTRRSCQVRRGSNRTRRRRFFLRPVFRGPISSSWPRDPVSSAATRSRPSRHELHSTVRIVIVTGLGFV